MPAVTWYFDFISPYAYFGLHTLKRLPAAANVRYQPVLLAGLLNHWGQKGPAEIPSKRVWTYRWCVWWAQQNDIPFRMPAAHPFNSLPYLRLSIAAGNSAQAIHAIFTALWTTGADPADSSLIAALAQSLGVRAERLADSGVKNTLRQNTAQASMSRFSGAAMRSISRRRTCWIPTFLRRKRCGASTRCRSARCGCNTALAGGGGGACGRPLKRSYWSTRITSESRSLACSCWRSRLSCGRSLIGPMRTRCQTSLSTATRCTVESMPSLPSCA